MKYDNIVNYVTKYAQEYFPSIAFREGTGAYDLFVKAFSIVSYDLFNKLSQHLQHYDVSSWSSLSEALVDAYGSMWFLSRSPGGRSTGRIRIYFSAPVAVSIPVGFAVLSNSGLRFITDAAYSFSESRMRSQREGGRYYCDVTVIATAAGSEYNVGIGAITDIETAFYAPWSGITNQHAFTQGADRETNEEFGARITESVNTRNLIITASSAETVMRDALPTVIGVEVIGYGDTAMMRDQVHYVMSSSGSPYVRTDFYRKTRANTLFNFNEAYAGSILASDLVTAIPDPVDIVAEMDEASQEQYGALGVEDLVFASVNGGEIIYEDFEEFLGEASFDSGDWVWSDSGQVFGHKVYSNSVYITPEGKLRLGAEDWQRAPIA